MYTLSCVCVCVKMWMSALWDPTVMNTQGVRTQTARTPAPVSTRTVERAKTAQVTRHKSKSVCLGGHHLS